MREAACHPDPRAPRHPALLVPAAPRHSPLLPQTRRQSRGSSWSFGALEAGTSPSRRGREKTLSLSPALPCGFSSTTVFFHAIGTLEEPLNSSICPTPHQADDVISQTSTNNRTLSCHASPDQLLATPTADGKGEAATAARSYFGLVGTVIAHPLPVLVHFIHQHFACAEVKGAEVHGAAQVSRQLRFAAELLTTWAEKHTERNREGNETPLDLDSGACCNSGLSLLWKRQIHCRPC